MAETKQTWSYLYDECLTPPEVLNMMLIDEQVSAAYDGFFFEDFNKQVYVRAKYVFTNFRFIMCRYYEFDFTDNTENVLSLPWDIVDRWFTNCYDEFNEERAQVYQEGRGLPWENQGWGATLTVETRAGEDWKFRIADSLVDPERRIAPFDQLIAGNVFYN